jgi:hypothetical protein
MNVEIGAEDSLFPEKEYISGIFVECVRAHFPRNKTLDSLSILSSQVLNLMSGVKSRTAGRGQWGMAAHKKERERETESTCIVAFYECTAEPGTIEDRKFAHRK